MLPDPANLDQYNPDDLKREAEELVKSELRAGADRLIESSPTASEMRDHFESLQDGPLKGMIPLSLSDIRDLSLADGEELFKEILKNTAEQYGIPTSVDEVEAWVKAGYHHLEDQGKAWLADQAMEAAAAYGIKSAYESISTKVAPMIGLATTTYEALEDGQLTQGEAMSIGTSAASTASTVFAGAAAVGVGMVGAVLAPAAIGTAFLESTIAAEEAYRRKVLKMSRQQVTQEAAVINAFLAESEEKIHEADRELWRYKELAIGGIAQDWSSLEHKVGNSFQLRFFPGAPPPLRGGWYREQPLTGGESYYLRKVACGNLAGCRYFPESASYHSFQHTINFLRAMHEAGYVLGRDSLVEGKYYAFNPYQWPQTAQVYGGEQYAYYWRALRAFDALVPSEKDSQDRTVGFWAHPGHEFRRRGQRPLKDYGLLGFDLFCRKDPRSCSQMCPYGDPNCTIPTEVRRERGLAAVAGSKYNAEMYNTAPWDMKKEATEYVEELFSRLQEDFDAVGTYRARIKGDLIQTASAVRGEKKTGKRLADMAKEAGLRFQMDRAGEGLDAQVKKQIKILDSGTRAALGGLEKRRELLNKGAVAAGGAVLAAGAWKVWGR